MVLPTNEYQSRIDNLNFRLGELLNTPHILSANEINMAQQLLEEYRTLNSQIKTTLENATADTDIGKITTNIGTYQEKIKDLEKRFTEVKQELDTSDARKRSVERVEQDVSYHQLYIMDRPLRQLSIPTLLTLSVVFIFVGIFFLYKLWGGSGHGDAAGHGLAAGHGFAAQGQGQGHGQGQNTGLFSFLKSSNTRAHGPAPAATGLYIPSFGLSSIWGK